MNLAPLSLALLLCLPLIGCGFAHVNQDLDTRPETNTGMGATTIYPGQRAPALGTSRTASAQSPAGGTESHEPDVTMIGGAAREQTNSKQVRNAPLGPLATLLGYPFWIFGKSLSDEAEEAQAEAVSEPARATTPDQRERNRLAQENDELLREINRGGAAPAATQLPAPHPTPSSASLSSSARPGFSASSIGAELAALRQALAPERKPQQPEPLESAAAQARDRNRDGRPDHWVFGPAGAPHRELFDDNHDGTPNRLILYDAAGEVSRVEEDVDGDGRMESVTLFAAGQPIRKRADTGQDGETDAWSFYSNGELVRHEVDRNADGFRDLILWYEQGQLIREEEDQNDDGRSDTTSVYAGGNLVQRDEDLDFDGAYDIQSFYVDGRLLRREVRSGFVVPEDEATLPDPPPGT